MILLLKCTIHFFMKTLFHMCSYTQRNKGSSSSVSMPKVAGYNFVHADVKRISEHSTVSPWNSNLLLLSGFTQREIFFLFIDPYEVFLPNFRTGINLFNCLTFSMILAVERSSMSCWSAIWGFIRALEVITL